MTKATSGRTSVIVIGAGHNGLTCATYLAKRGYNVTVVEARDTVGGMASSHEFAPGFQASTAAQFLYQMQPQIIKDLNLEHHGLRYAATDLANVALSIDGDHLRYQNGELSGPFSERDAEKMQEFHRLMTKFAAFMQRYNNKVPPLLAKGTKKDASTMAKLGLDIRRMGRDDMRDFLRVIAINIYDLLNEYFDSDLLKGALAFDAVLGTHLGPRSPNSVLTFLHRLSGQSNNQQGVIAIPAGGMGQVSQAFLGAAKSAGVIVRTGVGVKKVTLSGDRVSGVELDDGRTLTADLVVSNVDPKTTVMDLVGARNFETGFIRRISNLRMRGNASKLHLALNKLPTVRGLDDEAMGRRLIIAPDMDHVERAFNPAKYGECSQEPAIELSIPTVHDKSLAPEGQHVLSATVQYTPYHLKGGWTTEAKQVMEQRVMQRLEQYLPNLSQIVVASEFLSPADIESQFGVHGGHWHHGELALDQFLFVRPVVGAPQYQLPLGGLYLCGAGAHPGGGVSGSAGRNAAIAIIGKGAAA